VETFGTALQYAYYLRFHLVISFLWLALVYLSGRGKGLAPMLGGIFCLSTKRLAGASAAATFLLFSCVATADLVFAYGPQRFGICRWGSQWTLPNLQLEHGTLLFLAIPGAAWLLTHVRLVQASGRRVMLAALAGSAAAALLAYGALAAREYLPQLDFFASSLLRWTPQGYFDACVPGAPLYSGHRAAMAILLLSLLLYLFAGWWTGKLIKDQPKVAVSAAPELPVCTLVWILGLLLLASWFLGAIAFFSDGFPSSALVNALVLLVIAGLLARLVFKAEPHTYRGIPIQDATNAPTPEHLLGSMPKDKAIIVCASGGGIHAGAWAAAILDLLCREVEGFRKHVVLTSSVSGGSVGCYYFLASYSKPGVPIFPMVACSSLDYAAWGYAFRDLVRYFFPLGKVFKWGNRAWAIERAWRRFLDLDGPGNPLEAVLDDWQKDACNGERPGCVFNTTIVETGQRFPISSVDLGVSGPSFRKLYPQHTVRAATAANLSAAFPYVSPASRIWTQAGDLEIPADKAFHLVDGGYYDNYGILSAVEFIDAGFAKLGAASPDVLILRIEGHPVEHSKPGAKAGLRFQTGAPLKTMFTMRSESQVARNELDLHLLRTKWAAALGRPQVIQQVKFTYPCPNAPLSWHLTEKQKREITEALGEASIQAAIHQVKKFVP
jgi:hypothetical protein